MATALETIKNFEAVAALPYSFLYILLYILLFRHSTLPRLSNLLQAVIFIAINFMFTNL